MALQSLLPSTPSRSRHLQSQSARMLSFFNVLQDNLSLSTLLLIGACIQSCLVLLLPIIYALTPAVALLVIRSIDTALITARLKPNPYMKGAIMKKSTAIVPDRNGELAGAGQEKVAVLLLGAKSNHPLGIFAPDFGTVGNFLQKMTHELESGLPQEETGFLGQTGYSRRDANQATELVLISYWRSIEDVHRYAHGPQHREAWKWWEKTIKQHDYIGFMHEVYEADRGQWEAVYINFQPTDLGATTYLRRDGEMQGGSVADEWISPLVDANRGKMRTSAGRRGQTHAAADRDKFGTNVYVA